MEKVSSNHDTVLWPLLDHLALNRQFAFVWIIHGHPSHKIPVLSFQLLVFRLADCSSSSLQRRGTRRSRELCKIGLPRPPGLRDPGRRQPTVLRLPVGRQLGGAVAPVAQCKRPGTPWVRDPPRLRLEAAAR